MRIKDSEVAIKKAEATFILKKRAVLYGRFDLPHELAMNEN